MFNNNQKVESIKNSLNLGRLPLYAVILSAGLLSACSDDPAVDGPDNPDGPAAVESVIGANVKVNNDADALTGRYVTNYSSTLGSRSYDTEMSGYVAKMPDATVPADALDLSTVTDWNVLNTTTNLVVPAGKEVSVTFPLNNEKKIYVAGKLTLSNWGNSTSVYLLEGGELVYTDWQGNESPIPLQNGTAFYWYAGGVFNGKINSSYGSTFMKDGDFTYDGTLDCGGKFILIDGNLIVNELAPNNAYIQAASITVENNWNNTNATSYNINTSITVKGDATISAGPTIRCQCLTVGGTLTVNNAGNFNVSKYLKAGKIVAMTQMHLMMGGNALIDAGEELHFDNDQWSINFRGSHPGAIVAGKVSSNLVQNPDRDETATVDLKFICNQLGSAYIAFNSLTDGNGKEIANYALQQSVQRVERITIKEDKEGDGCRPYWENPADEGQNVDPLPPTIPTVVTEIKGEHNHEISATGIALDGNRAYISWHKRGTAIHGCLEAVQFDASTKTATLTSWLETEDGKVEGGNNLTGNSAAAWSDAQGEYDFNHLVVANEGGKKYILTVGDNAKKGAFLGAVELDGNGDFGMNANNEGGILVARGMMPNDPNKALGLSGNSLVQRASDKAWLIACAGGYQEYTASIADLGARQPVPNTKTETQWVARISQMNQKVTDGSVKHVATNGSKVVALEYTGRASTDGTDYWFNDNETSLGARLVVNDINDWMGDNGQVYDLGQISPIYGKDVVAIDAAGNIYTCMGKRGIRVITASGATKDWSFATFQNGRFANKYANAAANGICVDNKYIYVAYGAAGLWVLDKNTLDVVSYYTYAAEAVTPVAGEASKASANYVQVDNNGYIYVAYGRAGVKILKLND